MNWRQRASAWGTAWRSSPKALYALTGWGPIHAENIGKTEPASTASRMKRDLANGQAMLADSPRHAYMVKRVYQFNGRRVTPYQPWGLDRPDQPTISPLLDGKNDGFITVTWESFRRNFTYVYTTWRR